MKTRGNTNIVLLLVVFFIGIAVSRYLQVSKVPDLSFLKKHIEFIPSISPDETQPTPEKKETQRPRPVQTDDGEPWGVAKKIGEHTYTIKLGQDDRMGTPQEILEALNKYRGQHSRSQLTMDDKLSSYTQTRADFFKNNGSTDEHAGLNHFLDNEDGFVKLGFNTVGENSYYGGPLYGVHLIEWLFASSAEHNANQLDPGWSHVGIGITDTSVNILFGAGKL